MKKLILSLCLILGFSAAFAQKSNVAKAENYTLQEKPDFAGAREAIKAAMQDEKTKADAKTYFTAGMIGFKENESFNTRLMVNDKSVDPMAKGKAIMEAYNYFLIADSLDKLPDVKGKIKPRYGKKIKDNIKELYNGQHNIIAYGAQLFDNKNYKEAYNVFNTYLTIPSLPVINKEVATDSTYNMIKYYAAIAATNNTDHTNAVKLYTDLKDDNYETKNVYQLLSEEYRLMKDTVNYLNTLKEGVQKFSKDPWFLQSIINHYIYSDQIPEASKYLNEAIALAPDVAQYYYVKGNVEERLGNNDTALEAFNKALELDPNMAGAYGGKGRVIFNKAVQILNDASAIRDNKLYQKEKEKADVIFKEAMPFLKKAVEINPEDTDFKQALKQLYYRLDMQAEYQAISKELGE
ncbi:MAG TPA: tetratricopeptide repeat protein [Paludibacteraceae bacterium]|nr:tetratricopeptide repeat protein [Paludibacteraceae bacterium]HPT42442.1 tetratricopeptide repeat protein [Paludibacteraceae bacterium]